MSKHALKCTINCTETEKDMQIIKASDFRSHFKEMASAASGGEAVYITRPHGDNVVLLSAEEYQTLIALREAHNRGTPPVTNKGKLESIRFHLINEKLGVWAKGCYRDNTFIILKGSKGRREDGTTSSAIPSILTHRQNLREDGTVDVSFLFLKDQAYKSPSLAANVLLSRTANGRTAWVTKEGKTINEVCDELGIAGR